MVFFPEIYHELVNQKTHKIRRPKHTFPAFNACFCPLPNPLHKQLIN